MAREFATSGKVWPVVGDQARLMLRQCAERTARRNALPTIQIADRRSRALDVCYGIAFGIILCALAYFAGGMDR